MFYEFDLTIPASTREIIPRPVRRPFSLTPVTLNGFYNYAPVAVLHISGGIA